MHKKCPVHYSTTPCKCNTHNSCLKMHFIVIYLIKNFPEPYQDHIIAKRGANAQTVTQCWDGGSLKSTTRHRLCGTQVSFWWNERGGPSHPNPSPVLTAVTCAMMNLSKAIRSLLHSLERNLCNFLPPWLSTTAQTPQSMLKLAQVHLYKIKSRGNLHHTHSDIHTHTYAHTNAQTQPIPT